MDRADSLERHEILCGLLGAQFLGAEFIDERVSDAIDLAVRVAGRDDDRADFLRSVGADLWFEMALDRGLAAPASNVVQFPER